MSFAIEGVLFEPDTVQPASITETDGLVEVRGCQGRLDRLAEKIIRGGGLCPDLYPEGDYGAGLEYETLEAALLATKDLDAKRMLECRTLCFKGVVGNCPFAQIEIENIDNLSDTVAQTLAGPKSNAFYANGGSGGWTTPALQSIRSVLNRTVLPGGNPVVYMNTSKKQQLMGHFAEMGLAPLQLTLDI